MFDDISGVSVENQETSLSLPSGISWTSSSNSNDMVSKNLGESSLSGQEKRPNNNLSHGQSAFSRLSPRILLTLHSPPTPSPTTTPAPSPTPSIISRGSRASYYVPKEVKVSYPGPSLGDEPNTKILQLQTVTPRPISSRVSRLSPKGPSMLNDTGRVGIYRQLVLRLEMQLHSPKLLQCCILKR